MTAAAGCCAFAKKLPIASPSPPKLSIVASLIALAPGPDTCSAPSFTKADCPKLRAHRNVAPFQSPHLAKVASVVVWCQAHSRKRKALQSSSVPHLTGCRSSGRIHKLVLVTTRPLGQVTPLYDPNDIRAPSFLQVAAHSAASSPPLSISPKLSFSLGILSHLHVKPLVLLKRRARDYRPCDVLDRLAWWVLRPVQPRVPRSRRRDCMAGRSATRSAKRNDRRNQLTRVVFHRPSSSRTSTSNSRWTHPPTSTMSQT